MKSTWGGLAVVAVATVIACGGEEIVGIPDEPIDGAWSFDGVFSDLDADVRCRLSGEATMAVGAELPLNGRAMSGTATTVLDCDVSGTPMRVERTAPMLGGRINDGALSFSFGVCAFNGRYLGAELEGAAGCVFELSPSVDAGTVGHWRAFRSDGTPGVTP